MKPIYLILGVMILLSLTFVSADLGTFKVNSNISIRILANCSNINLTEVTNNNQTYIINKNMTNLGGQTFNYTFSNTSTLGIYTFSWNNPCVDCSQVSCGNSFTVTQTGDTFSLGQIFMYLFFFIILLSITFFSVRLIKNNPFSKDIVQGKDSYDLKKRNEFLYYVNMLKQKTWILGLFGVYLSLLLFFSLSDQLLYNFGMFDLGQTIFMAVYIMTWGLVPFTLFWFIYIIFVFYNSTKDIIYYQLGAVK
jgi:hypothetical protein